MDMSPKISVDIDEVHREVIVAGEVDLATRSEVTEAAAELNEAGRGDIALDLDDVTFIDAAGVGAVVEVEDAQIERGTALHVWSANAFVRRVFSLCGLSALLERSRRSSVDPS
jgi:anti-anti-sigma factor